MISTWTPFQSFWSSPWAARLRDACIWLKREPAPVVPDTPDALAPSWIRPLCLQRVIGQGIAARLRWMREHPDQSTFLFPADAIPDWTRDGWTLYERAALRSWEDAWLAHHFLMEVERLLRIIQVPPSLMGQEVWTQAALWTCARLAQLYHEVLRRHQARRARRFVQDLLVAYIYWEPAREETVPEEAQAKQIGN